MYRDAMHSHPGSHTEYVEYLENEKGSVQIQICNLCTKIVHVLCEHKKNTWHGSEEENNRKLICDLCGADGT